jgi:rhamnosyltransferase
MNAKDVLAVVVSYNGLGKTRRTVDALRGQVGHVHIVDNGSGAESLGVLESLERDPGITVERLGENRGVGHALNLGVKRAREIGCSWLLTMDQDSVVDGSMIKAYQAAIERDPGLVCLSPCVIKNGRTEEAANGVVGYAITSGNLVQVRLFDQVGLYDEGFFVDCIDFDFSLRLRRAGYAVQRVSNAFMQHQLGEVREVPTFINRHYAEHSPVRRYYMSRNFMYMMERYLLRFPGFILKLAISHVLLLVLIAVYDPSPLKSYRAIAKGIWDYLARREGIYLERPR